MLIPYMRITAAHTSAQYINSNYAKSGPLLSHNFYLRGIYMKKKVLGLITAVMAVSAAQSIYAAELSVTPSHNSLSVNTFGTITTVESIPAYLYNDSNYFMLRDIGKLTGFTVDWEDNKIYLIKDPTAQDFDSLSDIKKADTITKNKQTYVSGKTQYTDIDCLNIDGYNYFKLRDLEEAMDFDCDWDSVTNTVLLTLNNGKYTSKNPMPITVDIFLDPDVKQQVIEEDVSYTTGSGDYKQIENYIKNNIDSDFRTADFLISEDDMGEIMPGVVSLYMYLNANGVRANFGYSVVCINGKAKLVSFIGEKNPNFNPETAGTQLLTDDEAKKMAVEADGLTPGTDYFDIVDYRITRYFDTNDLTQKCEVEVTYTDANGACWTTLNVF